jgi:hypothetical protein
MRRSTVQSSRPETSNHTLFWVDFITITSGSRFSVHTGSVFCGSLFAAAMGAERAAYPIRHLAGAPDNAIQAADRGG